MKKDKNKKHSYWLKIFNEHRNAKSKNKDSIDLADDADRGNLR